MTTIALTLPEWANGRNIYIMAGSEVVAKKLILPGSEPDDPEYSPLLIKTVRCNNCGDCCQFLKKPEEWHLGTDEWDYCNYLNEEDGKMLCTAPSFIRPWACVKGQGEDYDSCVIEFKPVG